MEESIRKIFARIQTYVRDERFLAAAAAGRTGHVRAFLRDGADVHARDDWALRDAASNGHTETVKVLLAAGANVHAQQDAPLRFAAAGGHTETVKLLLAQGADIYARDNEPVRFAATFGNIETMKALSDHMLQQHCRGLTCSSSPHPGPRR